MNAPARPRVIVADDDAAIRRLVEMALEDLDIELVSCSSGEAALAAQRERPARVLITDLMMPGLGGLGLLQALADDDALCGATRIAVFSAGLNAKAKAQLQGLPVWRLIDKPVSVLALASTVEEAIAETPVADATSPSARPSSAPAGGGETAAIQANFGGDAALYRAFRASCLAEFPADLQRAGAAWATADAPALRRVAHSLKSVLHLLGEADASAAARRAEDAAERGDWAACRAPWDEVRAALQRLLAAR